MGSISRAVVILIVLGATVHLLLAQRQHAENQQTSPKFGVVTLSDGSKFQTTLYDLKVIGKLRTKKKFPYYILSGVGCNGCDANTSIYIHSPSDGPMKNEGSKLAFLTPEARQTMRVVRLSPTPVRFLATAYPLTPMPLYGSIERLAMTRNGMTVFPWPK